MLVEDLEKEIGRLHLHPLTRVRVGGLYAIAERVEVDGGDLVIGAELDSSDIPDDFFCEEPHLEGADVEACVMQMASVYGDPDLVDADEPTLGGDRPVCELDVSDLVEWVVYRHRQNVRAAQRRIGLQRFLGVVTGKRVVQRAGEWVIAAWPDAAVVETKPL